MNVKEGDLAIIVGPTPAAGAVGTVGKFIGDIFFKPNNIWLKNVWRVNFPKPIVTMGLDQGEAGTGTNVLVRDELLRKIAGPDIKLPECEKEVEHA